MPINIPRLQRIESSGSLPSVGRVKVQAQDQSENILNRTQTAANVVEQGADIYQEFENDKIEQLSQEAEQEYTRWNNQKLRQLKSIEGDPTDDYVQYDVEAEEKFNEILEKRKDVTSRVKRHLKSNLQQVSESQYSQVLNQRGAQFETYEHNLFESTLNLKKDYLTTNASLVDPNEPSSFAKFDSSVNDIITTISKRGLKKGTVKQVDKNSKGFTHTFINANDEEVTVALTPMAKERVGKELTDGVSNAVNVLIASGENKKAKALRERYSGLMTPESIAKIDNKLKTADVKGEAANLLNSIRGKSDEEQIKIIENLPFGDLRSEVLSIRDANDRKIENLKKRKEETNEKALTKYVLENKSKFFGRSDLEADQQFKLLSDKISPEGVNDIKKLVDAPKTSSLRSQVKLNELFLSENVASMNPEDFAKHIVNLDETDRRKAWNRYETTKGSKTEPYTTAYNKASQILTQSLFAQGIIERGERRKISDDDAPKYNQMLLNLNDWLDANNVTNKTPPGEIKAHIDELIKSAKTQKLFGISSGGGWFSGWFGSDDSQGASREVATPTGTQENPLKGMSDSEVLRMRIRYKTQLGSTNYPEVNNPDFLNYVKENK